MRFSVGTVSEHARCSVTRRQTVASVERGESRQEIERSRRPTRRSPQSPSWVSGGGWIGDMAGFRADEPLGTDKLSRGTDRYAALSPFGLGDEIEHLLGRERMQFAICGVRCASVSSTLTCQTVSIIPYG
jgi:hypothetical protein